MLKPVRAWLDNERKGTYSAIPDEDVVGHTWELKTFPSCRFRLTWMRLGPPITLALALACVSVAKSSDLPAATRFCSRSPAEENLSLPHSHVCGKASIHLNAGKPRHHMCMSERGQSTYTPKVGFLASCNSQAQNQESIPALTIESHLIICLLRHKLNI